MQIVLIAIITFILAIDQFSLTELLYRPIIACPIIGAVLGDPQTGLIIGGTYELMMIGNVPVYGAQTPNALLGGIAAVIFAIRSGLPVNQAVGLGMIFSIFGQYIVTLVFTGTSGLMKMADQAAEKADEKGITRVNLISMCILGILSSALAIAAYAGGEAAGNALQALSDNRYFSFLMGGLGAAGELMRYAGLAALLKVIMADDMWGIYLAGFAMAAVISSIDSISNAALILCALVGIAAALHDYHVNEKISKIQKEDETHGS